MLNRAHALAGVGLLAAMLASPMVARAQSAAAQPAKDDQAPPCAVTLEKEAFAAQADPLTIRATYTQPLGDEVAVSFPEKSGIRVLSAEPTGGDTDARSLSLQLDASNAVAGEWQIDVRSDAGSCRGSVTVEAPKGGS